MTDHVSDLNIVILPSEPVCQQICEWSHRVSREFTVEFIVDNTSLLPHLSLYQARFPTPIVTRPFGVLDLAREIIESHQSFSIELDGFSSFAGVLFYDAERDSRLAELHGDLVEHLSPLRNGLLLPVHEQLLHADIDGAKKESIRLWGNPMCFEEFDPHITITRLIDWSRTEDAVLLLEQKPMSFPARVVAIAAIGAHGTCPKIFHRVQLRSE